MKSIHNSEGKEANHIEYQPIIDGDTNDHSPIYTKLLPCIEKERPNILVITSDLPLWLKSVDIILNRNLPVIPRLGGFHLLKSFLGTFGAIFADSGLRDIIVLIYPGEIAADSILNGNSYDKAIKAHFLIDAAIIQHVVTPNMFTDEELSAMERSVNNASNNQNGIESSDISIAEMVQAKIQSVFKQFDNDGRAPALWTLCHYMVETIRIFIRAERMADFSLHLSCITNRLLDIFAAGGHQNYAKATPLYVQVMLKYGEGSPAQHAITESFKMTGNHIARYSSHE